MEELRPKREELERASKAFQELRERLSRVFPFQIELYGSVAKGTAISGDLDLDVFVLVPRDLGREWIRREFLQGARRALEGLEAEERYAEHPYLRVKISGLEADVVPAVKISRASEAVTAADRTPFHTEYVVRTLTEGQQDQVRLLKKFMKGVGVYGAEIKVGGFSGYVAEILVASYGSFINTLRAASRWRIPEVVIPPGLEGRLGKREAAGIFAGSPLIIPDPVDERRNAAAAVTARSMALFITAARLFLRSPGPEFFKPPEPGEDLLRRAIEAQRRRGTCITWIILSLESSAPDNIWGELKSLSRKIHRIMASERHQILRTEEYWDERSTAAVIAVETLDCRASGPLIVRGPPAFLNTSLEFIDKQLSLGQGFWIDEEGRLWGVRKRPHERIMDAVHKILEKQSTPRDIRGVFSIVEGAEEALKILELFRGDRGFIEWASRFLAMTPLPTLQLSIP